MGQDQGADAQAVPEQQQQAFIPVLNGYPVNAFLAAAAPGANATRELNLLPDPSRNNTLPSDEIIKAPIARAPAPGKVTSCSFFFEGSPSRDLIPDNLRSVCLQCLSVLHWSMNWCIVLGFCLQTCNLPLLV